jgi:hypothetical protein
VATPAGTQTLIALAPFDALTAPYCQPTPRWRVRCAVRKSARVERVHVWVVRVLWLALPITVGPAVAHALREASGPVRLVSSIGLWALWVVGLVAALVPTTVSLTVLRLLAPVPVVLAVVAMLADAGWRALLALVFGGALVLGAFRGALGRAFVQGSAYGDEVRYPLRPPGQLVLGPLPVLWLLLAGFVAAGPLLLATEQWAVGAAATAVAAGLAVVLPRRFHRLSRRFLVFVPAGLVIHDHLVLVETALFRWRGVRSVARALSDTDALDLTGAALGPAVEVVLADLETIVRVGRRPGESKAVHARAFLCSPTLMDEVLARAAARRLR